MQSACAQFYSQAVKPHEMNKKSDFYDTPQQVNINCTKYFPWSKFVYCMSDETKVFIYIHLRFNIKIK